MYDENVTLIQVTGMKHIFITGVCYGYSLMDCAESPDVPFTLLTTRFETGEKD